MIGQKQLREILYYDQNTGLFYWKIDRTKHVKSGDIAGWDTHGYTKITVLGRNYYAHRLAWFYVNGVWPSQQIDHKDGNSHNNSIGNLRLSTQSKNNMNSCNRSDNTSGFRGVSKSRGRWRVRVHLGGKELYLGEFSCLDDAIRARKEAAEKYYGEFTSYAPDRIGGGAGRMG